MTTELVKTAGPIKISDNLYQRLGVSKNAPKSIIKSAWKRAAGRLHPDNKFTGNEAAFNAAKEAYEILSDDDLRAYYDQTGEIHSAEKEAEIEQAARATSVQIMQNVVNQEHSPDTVDVIAKIIQGVKSKEREFNQRRKALDDMTGRVKALLKRTKRRTQSQKRPPIIIEMLEARLESLAEDLRILARDRRVHARVIEIFREYEYDYEEPEVVTLNSGNTFSSFWKQF